MSEGIALGLALLGHRVLPDTGDQVDSAFASAWRDWSFRDRFDRVSLDVDLGVDGLHVMTRATAGKQTRTLFWRRAGRLEIASRDASWDPNREEHAAMASAEITGFVPLSGWVELAQSFLKAYGPPAMSLLPSTHDSQSAEPGRRGPR